MACESIIALPHKCSITCFSSRSVGLVRLHYVKHMEWGGLGTRLHNTIKSNNGLKSISNDNYKVAN